MLTVVIVVVDEADIEGEEEVTTTEVATTEVAIEDEDEVRATVLSCSKIRALVWLKHTTPQHPTL